MFTPTRHRQLWIAPGGTVHSSAVPAGLPGARRQACQGRCQAPTDTLLCVVAGCFLCADARLLGQVYINKGFFCLAYGRPGCIAGHCLVAPPPIPLEEGGGGAE